MVLQLAPSEEVSIASLLIPDVLNNKPLSTCVAGAKPVNFMKYFALERDCRCDWVLMRDW